MSTVIEYAEQQLAATGWAAIHLNVAMRLRPSLWGGIGTNALHDFGQVRHSAESLLAHFAGAHQIIVEGADHNISDFGGHLDEVMGFVMPASHP